jgi:hypothetical protein
MGLEKANIKLNILLFISFMSTENQKQRMFLKHHFPSIHYNTVQSKGLRMIVDAPWYVPNTVIRMDLQIPTVKEEIRRYSSQYRARLSAHPNELIVNLIELPDNRRL